MFFSTFFLCFLSLHSNISEPFFYVASLDGNRVDVVDAATNAIVDTITDAFHLSPRTIAADPTRDLIYVVYTDTNNVGVIDTTTNILFASIPVGTNPFDIVVLPDGSKAYVTNQADLTLSIIDLDTRLATTVAVPDSTMRDPTFMATDAVNGDFVYVQLTDNGAGVGGIRILSTATDTFVGSFALNVGAPTSSPSGDRIYFGAEAAPLAVRFIETATNSLSPMGALFT